MLWIGERLGALERACMRSVLRQGHDLVLWRYGSVDGVPEGVTLRDAGEVLPESAIVRHHTGSVALFSDRFRYELQRQGRGIWLDTDVYLLKPIPETETLLTEFEPGLINGGVLRLPPESPLLPPLLALFEDEVIPHWLPLRARAAAFLRRLTTGRADLALMPWGTAGPWALTAYARELGLDRLAAPPPFYSPVSWPDAGWIRDPSKPLESRIHDCTIALHLWNERIKAFKEAPAAPGSFLERLQREGAE
jgi:hypothetical protein